MGRRREPSKHIRQNAARLAAFLMLD